MIYDYVWCRDLPQVLDLFVYKFILVSFLYLGDALLLVYIKLLFTGTDCIFKNPCCEEDVQSARTNYSRPRNVQKEIIQRRI